MISIFVTQEKDQGLKEQDEEVSIDRHTAASKNASTVAQLFCPFTNKDAAGSMNVSYSSRPVLRQLLGEIITGSSTTVIACGPESLKIDVCNTTAELQSRLFQGSAKEIALHTESFGW